MSPRLTAINFTVRELTLVVGLLKRHAEVGQYDKDSFDYALAEKLERLLEIAKELEPIS